MKLSFTKTILVLLLGTIPFVSYTQTIELGATESFALFTADGAFNNTGEATTVTGDVGTHVGAFNAFPPGVLIGQIHVADPVSAQAATDVDVLYGYLDALTCGSVIGSTMGNGQILLPGIYCITEAASLNGDLILDAQCDADAIFIIQIDGALSTSTLANVILTNSASVCNIYWQINGAFNLGEGSVFRGNVVNNGAINLLEGSSLFGRGLSRSGAINLNTNVVNNNMLPVPLIITTTEPTSFCIGESIVLSGNCGGIWSNGASTPEITVSTAGDYFVTIDNGCGMAESNHIVVTTFLLPVCSISVSNALCVGQTTDLCVAAGLSGFVWSNGTTNNCVTTSTAGTYTVTITDQNGCTSSCSQTVTENPLPACIISGSNVICNGQGTVLCVPAGASGYIWSNGATNNCVNISTAGTYTVTITDQNGCTSSCSQTVTENSLPACTISGSNVICNGQGTVLCVPAGASGYIWSNGATTNCVNISSAGTYTVTITDLNGCTSSCSQAVSENPLPACTISGSNVICNGQGTVLCVPAGASGYIWSNGATNNCVNISSAGTYTVTITDQNGCTSSCSQTVSENPLPACSISGSNVICNGQSTTLCVPAGALSYLWSNGATTNCIVVNSTGSFSVTITYSDGCTSVCSQLVTGTPVPVCTISGMDVICEGQSTVLCVDQRASSYLWSTGDNSRCITISSGGTYFVTVTSADGCTSVCSHNVTVNPVPACSITGPESFCAGESAQICASSGASSYVWSNGASTSCITVNFAGTYRVTITATNGCTATCSHTIAVNSIPECSITGINYFCEGQSSELCATPGGQAYLWNNGATTACITINFSGNYTVTITAANGCISSCEQNVIVYPLPECAISGNNSLCEGQTIEICTDFSVSYIWSNGETGRCITISEPGTYSVTTTNIRGCLTSCSKTITLNALPSCNILGFDTFCGGGSSEICSANDASAYLWSTGETAKCITVSQSGNYIITITDENGCTSSCNKTIVVHPIPVCTIEGNNSFCIGESTFICVSEGFSAYLWNTGATTNCLYVTEAGFYQVTVTDSYGCTSVCNETIIIHPLPNCTIEGNDSFCEGSATELCVEEGFIDYWWLNSQTTPCITVTEAGLYAITVTDINGCVSTCSKFITIDSASVCLITGKDSICIGDSTTLCLPPGLSEYWWSTGESTNCITVSKAGLYAITLTYDNGCRGYCSKYVSVIPRSLGLISGLDSICLGDSSTLCLPEGMKGTWVNGETSRCLTVTEAGLYTVSAIDTFGCTYDFLKNVAVDADSYNNIISATGSTELCKGAEVTLTGNQDGVWNTGSTSKSIQVTIPGDYYTTKQTDCGVLESNHIRVNVIQDLIAGEIIAEGVTTFCQGGYVVLSGNKGGKWNTGEETNSIAVKASGRYYVVNTNECENDTSNTIMVNVNPLPVCRIDGKDTFCEGQGTQLCATSGMNYFWNTEETSTCIEVNKEANYFISVSDSNGCISTCSKKVSEILFPSCLITGDLNPKAGKITALCVRDEMSSYLWDTKETSRCIYVLSSGTKKVNIMNATGCLDSCSVSVIFEEDTSDVEDELMQSDKTYSYKIYPNPFNEKFTIDFQSSRSTPHFIIELFDVNGFKISTLYNESAIGGVLYSKEFYLENLTSGMYLVKLTDLGRITFKRLILIR
jgi:hypothetical protein